MDKININQQLDKCIDEIMKKIKKMKELEVVSWSYVFNEFSNNWIVILKVRYKEAIMQPLYFDTWDNCEVFTKDVLQKLKNLDVR